MPNKLPSVEIKQETIGAILRNKQRRLRVPINQRSYSWKPEHINELYSDWQTARADGKDEYFMGSIVVVNADEGTLVFDGQQRLATSAILIAAIRDWFYRAGDTKTATVIENDHLVSIDRKTHDEASHFTLNLEDRDYFLKRIIRNPDDAERKAAKAKPQQESHKRLDAAAAAAASFVTGIVANFPESEKGKQLHRWLDFIDDGARVVWVEVADETTAFMIFETMNDRGLRLSAADLLKNYLYGMSGDKKEEVVQKWQAMSGILESVEDDEGQIVEYIRYYWITRQGPTRTRDLYEQIKASVNNNTKIITFAADLEAKAHDYAAILNGSHEAWARFPSELRRGIETLRLLGVSQVRPLLLAASGKFTTQEFAKLILACTCWSVRCLIAGVPSGTLEGYYGRNALKITQGKITTTSELAKDMMQVVPDDARFRAAVATANVANAQLARYYLRALQLQEDGEKEPQYIPNDGQAVTLEHILPSKPGKGWEYIKPEDAKALCNRLGNQALLLGSVNSKIGNTSYAEKKAALTESKFSLTTGAAVHDKWDVDQITKRQDKLADLAVLAWPLKPKGT